MEITPYHHPSGWREQCYSTWSASYKPSGDECSYQADSFRKLCSKFTFSFLLDLIIKIQGSFFLFIQFCKIAFFYEITDLEWVGRRRGTRKEREARGWRKERKRKEEEKEGFFTTRSSKTTANFSVATPESPPHQQLILMSHEKIKWAENSIKKIGDSCYLIVQTAHT